MREMVGFRSDSYVPSLWSLHAQTSVGKGVPIIEGLGHETVTFDDPYAIAPSHPRSPR